MKATSITFIVSRGLAAITAVFLLAQKADAADVSFYVVSKNAQDYQQTDATSPPVLQAGNPYRLSVSVNLSAPNSVTSATVRFPSGVTNTLSVNSDGLSLGFSTNFATQSALDAAYPNGNYTLTMNTVHDGVRTVTLSLTGDAYPNTPHVSNYTAAQAVNPANDFTLAWDTLTSGVATDFILLSIKSSAGGNNLISTPNPGLPGALNGTDRSLVFAGHSLPPGQALAGRLMFAKIGTLDTNSYPGALGVAAYTKRTTFNLTTTVPAGFYVSPSVVTNDFVGKIFMSIAGFTPGAAVKVERFMDVNGNGVIDLGEPLVGSFTVTDGRLPLIGGVRNLNVPGDEDGTANGQALINLFYPSGSTLDLFAGNFICRVSGNGLAVLTQPFSIRQKTYPQGVTGRITAAVTGQPLATSTVVIVPANGPGVTGGMADANGNYTLYGPPGNFAVIPLASGFVADQNAGFVTVVSNQFVTKNLALNSGNLSVSGKLSDSASGVGIPGIFILARSTNNLFSGAFTDSSGNYGLQLTASQWEIGPNSEEVSFLGYVGAQDRLETNITGNVANLNFQVTKANALIYGIIRDGNYNPVAGISLSADDQNNQFEADGISFVTGLNYNYSLAVLAGCWHANPDNDRLAQLGYLSAQGANPCLNSGEATRADFVLRRPTAFLSGRVVDDTGAAVSSISIGAGDHQGIWISSDTDEDGKFDLGVAGGTWYLQLSNEDAQDRGWVYPDLAITVSDGADVTNITYTVKHVTARITGFVRRQDGSPVPNIDIHASVTSGGLNYYPWTRADGNGNYQLGVFNATWQVNVNCYDLGQQCLDCPPSETVPISGADGLANFEALPMLVTTTSLSSGRVGEFYNVRLSASGGPQSYNWSLAAGALPVGLTLDGSGNLSGAPAAAGTSAFTVRVTSGSCSADQALSITITPSGPLQITTTSLADACQRVAYDSQLQAAGQSPFSWAVVSGSLPSGMSLAASGALSGLPTASGAFCFNVQVTDAFARTATTNLCLTVNPALQIVTGSVPNRALNCPYPFQLQASGCQPPFTWSLSPGSAPLPTGSSLAANGIISGSPVTNGTFVFVVRVRDAGGRFVDKSLSWTINPPLQVDTSALPDGVLGCSYSAYIQSSGGVHFNRNWVLITGSLPPGLFLFFNSGYIAGTPSDSGTYNFTVRVTDGLPTEETCSADRVVTITIFSGLQLDPMMPRGLVGAPYCAQLKASAGQAPYTWSLAPGSLPLPAGWTLSPSGLLTGTPASATSFSFIAQVSDNGGCPAQSAFTVTIGGKVASATPKLEVLGFDCNDQLRLWFSSLSGRSYRLQSSATLQANDWVTLLTTNAVADTVVFSDPQTPGNSYRFYRVISP